MRLITKLLYIYTGLFTLVLLAGLLLQGSSQALVLAVLITPAAGYIVYLLIQKLARRSPPVPTTGEEEEPDSHLARLMASYEPTTAPDAPEHSLNPWHLATLALMSLAVTGTIVKYLLINYPQTQSLVLGS